jgi:hypothetical protein
VDAMLAAIRDHRSDSVNDNEGSAYGLGYRVGGWRTRSTTAPRSEAEWRAFEMFVVDRYQATLDAKTTWDLFEKISENRAAEYRRLVANARQLANAAP